MNGLLIFLFFVTVSTLSYMLGYHTRVKKDKPPIIENNLKEFKGSIVNGCKFYIENDKVYCEVDLLHKSDNKVVKFIIDVNESKAINDLINQFITKRF